MTLGLVVGFMGILLAYSAIRDEHPWCPILTAFGRPCPPKPGGEGPGKVLAAAASLAGLTGNPNPTTTGSPGGGTPSGLTKRAAAFKAAVESKIAGAAANYLGGVACRTIRPHDGSTSTTISEHAWGNAVDYGGPTDLQHRVYAFAMTNKLRYGIVNIIPAGSAINAVHIDFAPSHAGQPCPCSGGCSS